MWAPIQILPRAPQKSGIGPASEWNLSAHIVMENSLGEKEKSNNRAWQALLHLMATGKLKDLCQMTMKQSDDASEPARFFQVSLTNQH